MNPRWSILIAAADWRPAKLMRLLDVLLPQAEASGQVEVIACWNGGEPSLGEIRDALMAEARGAYLSFADSDDVVAPDFVPVLLEALATGPDCAAFDTAYLVNGFLQATARCSIFTPQRDEPGRLTRDLIHMMPVRSELARKGSFGTLAVYEDAAWRAGVLPHLRTEARAERTLYLHLHEPSDSAHFPRPREHQERPEVSSPCFRWLEPGGIARRRDSRPQSAAGVVRDLLVIVPSRGRPEQLRDMVDACLSLSEADTEIAVALDDDDPRRDEAMALISGPRVMIRHGDRDNFTGWSNEIAEKHKGRYRAYASLSDDTVPRTRGWDRLLLEAISAMGGTGIAYGDDLLQRENLPTAPVITCDIVEALGWMCEPSMTHFSIDNVWKDLGEGAGCLAYVPTVIIEHLHPCAGKAPVDQTHRDAGFNMPDHPDSAAYHAWRRDRMAADIATVKRLLPMAVAL